MNNDYYDMLRLNLERAIREFGVASLEATKAYKDLSYLVIGGGAYHVSRCRGRISQRNWDRNCTCSLAPAIQAYFDYQDELKAIPLAPKFQEGRDWFTADDGNDFERLARALTPENVRAIRFRKKLSGRASWKAGAIEVPRPKTCDSCYVYLHECAHILIHSPVRLRLDQDGRNRKSKGWEYEPEHPRYVWEYQAEQWAHQALPKYGFPVSLKMMNSAKQYVLELLKEAVAGGLREIDPDIAKWCGWKGWKEDKFIRRKADAPEFVPVPDVLVGKRANKENQQNGR